jgi:SAM-dependent methyltransferase
MNPKTMEPFGSALWAYFEGDIEAELVLHRDDDRADSLPIALFFRGPDDFSSLETTALDRCRGRVLDVGGGSGLHSLVLQEQGLDVTAIDIDPRAVKIMQHRGVEHASRADVFEFVHEPFDTLLMLGHGIGMVETLDGLERFLERAKRLVADGGQLLLDSLDVRTSDDPSNRAYLEANRRAGRYIGEVRLRFEHHGAIGPEGGWLHVDPATLTERAAARGWSVEVLFEDSAGNYLARLARDGGYSVS